jgi:hypothetical protein
MIVDVVVWLSLVVREGHRQDWEETKRELFIEEIFTVTKGRRRRSRASLLEIGWQIIYRRRVLLFVVHITLRFILRALFGA